MNTDAIIPLLLTYRYWILFPLTFIEGPIISLIAGLFVANGTLSLLPTYIILCLGDIVPDTLYFGVGTLGRSADFLSRYLHRFGFSEKRLLSIERLWQQHTFKSVLFSKWAYGLSTPLLMTAGLAKIPVGTFLRIVIPVVLIQYAILLMIGYEFGSSYAIINTYIQDAGWLVAIGVIVFLVLYFFVSQHVKRVFLRESR